MRRIQVVLWLVLLAPVALAQQGATLIANFNPSAGDLSAVPFPINLLFSGSTDGTLNIPPLADPTDPANGVIQALNALDGFSTVAPLVATFSNGANSGVQSGIAPASVVAGQTVRLFQVELNNPFAEPGTERPFAVTGATRELRPNVDFAAVLSPNDPTGKTLVILPLQPLEPKTGYMVVLTNGIRAALDNSPAFPDLTYILARYRGENWRPILRDNGQSDFARLSDAEARQLAALNQLVASQEEAASDFGVDRGSIVLSWTFTTQSIEDVLEAVRAQVTAQPATLRATGRDTNDFVPSLPGIADVYVGTLQIPYYLQAPASQAAWPVILSTFWRGANGSFLTRYNPVPVATQNLTIPVLVTVPNAASGQTRPAGGWPVAIFQHGITQNRTNLLAIADTLASVGFAGIAIDLPLHGITDPRNPLYNGPAERTFNVDLVDNETLAPPPDGLIDPSGVHYINLFSLLTSRDNIRQGVADLFHLTATVPGLDIDGDNRPDFDPTQLRFIGHSLGAIVGVPYLGIETAVSAATLANPGGGIARLLEGSPRFGPPIRAGLAQVGLLPGTPLFDFYFLAAQTVVDAADPINYAVAAADLHPIHMLEVVGTPGDPLAPPDQVIPNTVPGAPLSGTEPLARVMGLTAVDSTTQDPNGVRALVRFTEGAHSSFLSPEVSPAVTVEMQRETAGFMASDGTLLPIMSLDGIILPIIHPTVAAQ